jgi:hypothetical protein
MYKENAPLVEPAGFQPVEGSRSRGAGALAEVRPPRAAYRTKFHTQALIALARRVIGVRWTLLRDGRPLQAAPPLTA